MCFFGVLIMVKRGRPAKVLSNEDLIQLQQFLEKLPFLTEIQSHVLRSLLSTEKFDEEIFKKFKTVDGVVSGNGKYSTLRIFTPTSFNDIQHGIFA